MPIISNFPVGGNSGAGGIPLAPVKNLVTVAASEKVYIKWTDPGDLVSSESTLATWEGTLLMRKAGSPPVNRRDGVMVIDNKTLNQYSEQYFIDSGLSNGITYYYKFFPYSTTKTYTDDDANEFVATPQRVTPGDVSDLTATPKSKKILLRWTDPDQTITSNGIMLSNWQKTTVVVKVGGYAASPDDMDAVFTYNSMTRNQYSTTDLVIDNLTNGVEYFISLFPTSDNGAVNINEVNRISVTPNVIPIKIPSVKTQPVVEINYSQSSGLLRDNCFKTKTVEWNDYDAQKMTTEGSTTYQLAGEYSTTFTPMEEYCWEDGSTNPATVHWTVLPGKITAPYREPFIWNKVLPNGNHLPYEIPYTISRSQRTMKFAVCGDFDGNISVSCDPADALNCVYSDHYTQERDIKWRIDTDLGGVIRCEEDGYVIDISPKDMRVFQATITVTFNSKNLDIDPLVFTVIGDFTNHIYGVEWDGTATTALSRTDDAVGFVDPVVGRPGNGYKSTSPFDNIYPWSNMIRTFPIKSSIDSEMVKIPKFYYKWTKNGNSLKLQISQEAVSGFHVSPAHEDRGDGVGERDAVYIGISLMPNPNDSGYLRLTAHRQLRYKMRSYGMMYGYEIYNPRNYMDKIRQRINDNNVHYNDYRMITTIQMLYLVEFADWDTQSRIGVGNRVPLGDDGFSTFVLSSENYDKCYGAGTYGADDPSTPSKICSYRGIADLFVASPEFIDGMYRKNIDGALRTFIINNPQDYANRDSNTGGIDILPKLSGFPTQMDVSPNQNFPWLLIPGGFDGGGSNTSYIPDWYYAPSTQDPTFFICWGGTVNGRATGGLSGGLFGFGPADFYVCQRDVSCRAQYLPSSSN